MRNLLLILVPPFTLIFKVGLPLSKTLSVNVISTDILGDFFSAQRNYICLTKANQISMLPSDIVFPCSFLDAHPRKSIVLSFFLYSLFVILGIPELGIYPPFS